MPKRVVITDKPDPSASINIEILGQFVRHKRTFLGMTLEDAASLCGLSKQAYSNVEKGLGNVRAETLFKVLVALGIKLSIDDRQIADGDGSDVWQ